MDRVPFQAAMRAAAVDLIQDYAASINLTMTLYRARPANIQPPHAFIDAMRETPTGFTAPSTRERVVECDVVCVWGLFDSASAVDQRDAFVDGFSDWVIDDYHAAGPNTLIAVTQITDDPSYRPDWPLPERQRTYFATVITLEGRAAT